MARFPFSLLPGCTGAGSFGLSSRSNMRDIIERHNRLNGFMFSVIEFGLVAVFVGAFGTYYLIHRRWGLAFIGWGITLNCVPVFLYGLRRLAQAGAKGQSISSYYSDKGSRKQLRRENPHMLRDTMVLTIGTVLPFASLAAVLFNLPRPQKP